MPEKITDKEKLKLVMGQDWWQTSDLNGKVGQIKVSDGPMGLRCLSVTDSWENASVYPSVAYPCYQMLSQTWNLSLAQKMGGAIADDCIDFAVDVLLGPGVNLKRTPLCGRNFEYFSEDPYLSGMFGKCFIEGVQQNHVGVSLKHFCCNNREYSRYWLSSEVDERTLRELYLKPFEIALKAKPWTVMCAYNPVNGVLMSEHRKLFGLLREEYGFDGVIISDWQAVRNPLASLHAGLDLEMPYDGEHAELMKKHLAAGEIDLKCLNRSAERVLSLVNKTENERKLRSAKTTVEERIAISQEVEEEGIVLLKNNGVLPLLREKICVTGAPAVTYYYGGGSSAVTPNRPFTFLDDALRKLGYDACCVESLGEIHGSLIGMGNLRGACIVSDERDVTILTIGTGSGREIESTDRRDLSISEEELEALRYLRRHTEKLVVVIYAGSVLDLSEVSQLADAVVLAGFGGQNVSLAVANVLTGKVNPSGRLTETYVYSANDVPAERTWRNECCAVYEEKLNVGYRYFETQKIDVQYPFGFGLSYSNFSYSDLNAEVMAEEVRVSFYIQNISDVDGKEVVQLYVQECNPVVYRPLRELKAFDKVEIKAHEKRKITFELTMDAFSYYSDGVDDWIVNDGAFIIEIGKNAHEIVLEERINISSSREK